MNFKKFLSAFIAFCLVGLSFSFQVNEAPTGWTYVYTSNLHDVAEINPDTTFHFGNYLLKKIKHQYEHFSFDLLGNQLDHRRESHLSNIELIDLNTEKVYVFSINDVDTTLIETYDYSNKKDHSGFDIIQLKAINKNIASSGLQASTWEKVANNQYSVRLNNDTYKMILLIEDDIQSPFNISIEDSSGKVKNGVLTKLWTSNTGVEPTFEHQFQYIPDISQEATTLIKKLVKMTAI